MPGGRLAPGALMVFAACEAGPASPPAPPATHTASTACSRPNGHVDADGDGFGDAARGASGCDPGTVDNADDCDDTDPTVHGPTAFYRDQDRDGWGGAPTQASCTPPPGAVDNAADCDDNRPEVHPDALERCNGIDDDCDGLVDDDDTTIIDRSWWFRDVDADGYGDPEIAEPACAAPHGYVDMAMDCDDGDPDRSPSSPERCLDGTDDDCDGLVDEQCPQLLDEADALIHGAAAWDMLGASIQLGDWDGDGTTEVAIGAPGSDAHGEGAGDVHLITAAQVQAGGDIASLSTKTLHGSRLDIAGFTLQPPVDLNQDGYDDLVLGLVGGGPGLPGGAAVVLGPVSSSAALTSVEAFRITGASDYDGLGVHALGIGQLRNDTPASILVGIQGDDTRAIAAGAALVFHAPLSDAIPLAEAALRIEGATEGGGLGTATVIADLDGDGLDDILLGEPGAARVVAWPSPDLPWNGTVLAASAAPIVIADIDPESELGTRVVAADVHGDGYLDLLVGAPAASVPYPQSGRWDVVPGPFTGARRLDGPATARFLDASGRLTSVGDASSGVVMEDLDQDGILDLILGGPGHWTNEVGGGGAFWFHGPLSGVQDVSAAPRTVLGTVVEEAAGAGLAAGDLNGDGLFELLVGAPMDEDDYGRVGVFFGDRTTW
ncbi:MAG: hypothetical protein CL927_12210 [Deltaproteobacteria bacterium]|nr:hypothetical protein [Deltaproteobacteria bacterium]HCH64586.1 hypothetical protein [Deltaproteobacteria bacterium]